MPKRIFDPKILCKTEWSSIFNKDKEKDHLSFLEDCCCQLRLTHADLRPLPTIDPDALERTRDTSPMLPHYYDQAMMARELERLYNGVPKTELIPIISVGGAGDNLHARTPISGEWLQVICLPTDWLFDEQRELEVLWWKGVTERQIMYRYRRHDTPRSIAGQMRADYWGSWQLDSHKIVFTTTGRVGSVGVTVSVIKCLATAHVEDEHGVGTSNPLFTNRSMLIGQLDNGIVLWWHRLRNELVEGESVIRQQGGCVEVDGRTIQIVTGEGSRPW